MKVIDRYILRTFFINFVVLLGVLMMLVVLVDFISNIDEFIKGGRSRADTYGSVLIGTIVTTVGYYGPQMIRLYVYFSGLLVVSAMGFTFTAMLRQRELIAMVASGISMYRIAAPVLVAGVALNALTLPAQEFIIPSLASNLVRSKSNLDREAIERFAVPYAADADHNLLAAAEYDDENNELRDVTITIRDENKLPRQRITADRAVWDESREGWSLDSGQSVSPQQTGALRAAAQTVDFFPTELSPRILLARRESSYKQMLSLQDLDAMRTNLALPADERARITQIVWSRFSLLVVNVLILVAALPLFLLLTPRTPLKQGIKGAGLCIGSWGAAILMLQIPVAMLPPVVSAWLPAALLLVLGIAMLQWLET